MPFTAQEIDNIANAALDFFLKGDPLSQTIQDRPLMKKLMGAKKTFPGGKSDIRGNVKGDYTTTFMGFSQDDTVSYSNPANIKQFNYPWRELHAGISMTFSELKSDGITVVDTSDGDSVTQHSDRELTAISNMMDDKLEDMREGSERSFNNICWQDGTQSAKVFAGIQSFIVADPTTGVAGGIDRSANTWWRNRALTGASKITSSTSAQTLTKTLRQEVRQLRRYGGKPNLWIAGSDFIKFLEAEVHEKGYYSQTGFFNKDNVDVSMPAISLRDVGDCMYDPTLDDLGFKDYSYMLDTRHIRLYEMEGEGWKKHSPARPAEKYVLYRAVTWTGAMVCRKMNAHGVYQAA